jgi:HlyD family secretion protein
VRASVGEHYVARVYEGLEGTFTFSGGEYKVTVVKVFPEVNNGEFEVDLHFAGDPPQAVKRGQSLQLKLQLSEDMEAVLLPRGPFFQDTGGQWVYVIDANGTATKRAVQLGRQNPDMYEVLEGLQPGDRVITSRYAPFNDADEIIIQ